MGTVTYAVTKTQRVSRFQTENCTGNITVDLRQILTAIQDILTVQKITRK